MAKYAERTLVPAHQSQAELVKLMKRFDADRWATFNEPGKVTIVFEMHGVPYKFTLPAPPGDEQNRLWRSLVAVVKARLVAIDDGIETFEGAFMGNIVLKGGTTIGEKYQGQLPTVAANGIAQLALPGESND